MALDELGPELGLEPSAFPVSFSFGLRRLSL